jgi:hypothetical protein
MRRYADGDVAFTPSMYKAVIWMIVSGLSMNFNDDRELSSLAALVDDVFRADDDVSGGIPLPVFIRNLSDSMIAAVETDMTVMSEFEVDQSVYDAASDKLCELEKFGELLGDLVDTAYGEGAWGNARNTLLDIWVPQEKDGSND